MGDQLTPTRSFLKVRGTTITGQKRPTSYIETVIHTVKGYVGTGIFAMGVAFMNSGMLLGPVLLVIIALISLHCQHLLIKACVKITEKEPVEVLPSYAETVQYTFDDSKSEVFQKWSNTFSILTDAFLVICQYLICVVYFIFVSSHFADIAAANGWKVDYRIMLLIILIPMWLSTFLGNLKFLIPVSIIGNILIWIGICMVLYYSSLNLPPISDRDVISQVHKIPLFFGIVLFAFEAITMIIPFRMEMKNQDLFTTKCGVLNVSMMIVVFLYLTVGIFTYWQWGEEIKGSAFLNMPEHEALSQVTKCVISLAVMLSYALQMYVPFEILYPRFYKKWGPFKHPDCLMYLYRSVAVLLTYALANISENLGSFIGFAGALTGAFVAMFLPALLELVMLQGELTYFIIIKDVFIILLAIAGAITGTVLSFMDIVKEYTG